MNYREKAKSMFDRVDECTTYIHSKDTVKQLVSIMINEIIKSKDLTTLFTEEELDLMEFTSDDRDVHDRFIQYWSRVIKEVEKLPIPQQGN